MRIVLCVSAVDDYLDSLDVSTRAAFEHIRNLVMDLAPEAEQGISYGMATLKYRQKPLLAFSPPRTISASFRSARRSSTQCANAWLASSCPRGPSGSPSPRQSRMRSCATLSEAG
jgi:hypothetical protein